MISEAEMIQNIACNLRELLISRGWSQAELARRAGLSEMQVCRIVKGRQQAGAFYIARILEALDCSFDRLIRTPPTRSPSLRAG